MENELEQFYLKQEEPNKSVFLYLRELILSIDKNITPEWKYKLPFFYFRGKMFCYLWQDKKTKQPYVCFCRSKSMNHPKLVKGERKKMKAYYINPNEDIDVEELKALLLESLNFFK
ncbi:MAG: DUF1801 domain-containing protein [Chitinophagales bacterium]